ncbi:MAG: glycosyl transferase family 2 [Flavobacteriales bacterium]|nr:glycosyl transferase family 2 [Flavobacteriales bacterium]
MILGKKIVVVMPAYNASKTLERTYKEIPHDLVDEVVVVDDCSQDDTAEKARSIGVKHLIQHQDNLGYGGNQKSCYKKALELGADVVVMVHPDYQYTPLLIPSLCYPICNGLFEVMLGSRILGKGALKGGMPFYKYVSNRMLTFFQNIMVGAKLSEYHTGYRAFSREVLEKLDFEANSNNFVFDNQMLSQIIYAGYEIGEVTCPTHYFDEGSSINLKNSMVYGFGVIEVSLKHRLQKWGLASFAIYGKK